MTIARRVELNVHGCGRRIEINVIRSLPFASVKRIALQTRAWDWTHARPMKVMRFQSWWNETGLFLLVR